MMGKKCVLFPIFEKHGIGGPGFPAGQRVAQLAAVRRIGILNL